MRETQHRGQGSLASPLADPFSGGKSKAPKLSGTGLWGGGPGRRCSCVCQRKGIKVSSRPAWPREGPASFSGCLSQGCKAPINRLWPPRAWFWADEYR